MFSVLPFRPTKGAAFKVYFDTINITNYSTFLSSTPTNMVTKISKDNGAWASTTNNFTAIGTPAADNSAHYVQLTATEMDADIVIVSITNYNASAGSDMEAMTIVIYTDGTTGFSSGVAQIDTIDGLEHLPNSDPKIGDLFNALYFYLRKYKNRRGK